MKKKFLTSLLVVPLLSSCTISFGSNPFDSSNQQNSIESIEDSQGTIESLPDSQQPNESHNDSKDSVSDSTIIQDDDFLQFVKDMRRINMTNNENALPEDATFNEKAPLGSPSHPISGSQVCSTLSITFFEQPTRYGDSIYVKCDDSNIIIDMGTTSSLDKSPDFDLTADIKEYKKVMGNLYSSLDKIDLLVITHPHEDHLGAISNFTSAFTDTTKISMIVDYGWTNTSAISRSYQSFRKAAIDNGTKYCSIYNSIHNKYSCSSSTYITPNLFINWLDTLQYFQTTSSNPSQEKAPGVNESSVTGILNFNDFSFYFSGDLDALGESNVVDNNTLHPVTLMKATHHGTENGNSTKLLNAIKPEIVEISTGADLTKNPDTLVQKDVCSGHPYRTALSRIMSSERQKGTNENIYLNQINGTTTFYTKGHDYVYMQGSPRYRQLIKGINPKNSSDTFTLLKGDTKYIYSELKETPYYSTCMGK